MDVRNSVTPHELEFTVDDEIIQGVDKSIKGYEQTVSLVKTHILFLQNS